MGKVFKYKVISIWAEELQNVDLKTGSQIIYLQLKTISKMQNIQLDQNLL